MENNATKSNANKIDLDKISDLMRKISNIENTDFAISITLIFTFICFGVFNILSVFENNLSIESVANLIVGTCIVISSILFYKEFSFSDVREKIYAKFFKIDDLIKVLDEIERVLGVDRTCLERWKLGDIQFLKERLEHAYLDDLIKECSSAMNDIESAMNDAEKMKNETKHD